MSAFLQLIGVITVAVALSGCGSDGGGKSGSDGMGGSGTSGAGGAGAIVQPPTKGAGGSGTSEIGRAHV